MYQKDKVFIDELKWIQSDELRAFAAAVVQKLPDYFFDVPASSTGKYHSSSCLGPGGLVRHTKAALILANDFFRMDIYPFSQEQKDCILIALLFHDGWKHGDVTRSKYTSFDHPLVAVKHIEEFYTDPTIPTITNSQKDLIASAMSSHMGKWNTNTHSSVILPIPESAVQKFVHFCDYCASRSYLVYKFEHPYDPAQFAISEDKAALQNGISALIDLCKQKIASGEDRETIYGIIAKFNNNVKNPMKIQTLDIVNKITSEVEALA